MSIPETLRHKIEVFRSCGRVALYADESFQEPSWVSIFTGQFLEPRRYDPLVDHIPIDHLQRGMQQRRGRIAQIAQAMPTLREYVTRNWSATQQA
jgi:tryptophan halogenase